MPHDGFVLLRSASSYAFWLSRRQCMPGRVFEQSVLGEPPAAREWA
jgi:hypothetical protein